MKYQLTYHLMCTVDGEVDEKQSETEIDAPDDAAALETGNRYLKQRGSGLAIPWAPKLRVGERLVAFGDPGHPPTAHHLAHTA